MDRDEYIKNLILQVLYDNQSNPMTSSEIIIKAIPQTTAGGQRLRNRLIIGETI
jgi:hypothetical protein